MENSSNGWKNHVTLYENINDCFERRKHRNLSVPESIECIQHSNMQSLIGTNPSQAVTSSFYHIFASKIHHAAAL